MIHAASSAKCGAKGVIAAFQSVDLIHVQRGTVMCSAARRMSMVAVTKAWSLPAMGLQNVLPTGAVFAVVYNKFRYSDVVAVD